MAITETAGKKFIQLNFAAGSGDTWTMSKDMLVRSVRLTTVHGSLADADYVTLSEDSGAGPNVCVLNSVFREIIFQGKQMTKLAISTYSLTYPTAVVVSIEVD